MIDGLMVDGFLSCCMRPSEVDISFVTILRMLCEVK